MGLGRNVKTFYCIATDNYHDSWTCFRVIDIQQELDEYTENSAQLEKELEASLVQVEKQNRDLEHQNQRLKNEIEMLRVNIINFF